MSLSSQLRNRVTLYGRTAKTNTLNEIDYTYAPVAELWAEILPARSGGASAEMHELPGDMTYTEATHKVVIRTGGPKVTADMYFMCRGSKLDILYSYPHYKLRDRVEIFCREDVGV